MAVPFASASVARLWFIFTGGNFCLGKPRGESAGLSGNAAIGRGFGESYSITLYKISLRFEPSFRTALMIVLHRSEAEVRNKFRFLS